MAKCNECGATIGARYIKDDPWATADANRYQVRKGSQSAHCCFEATVVDTATPRNWFKGDDKFEPVCECFELADAERIATALNAQERRT